MTHHCGVCGNLLDGGYPCDRCYHDPEFDDRKGGDVFAFDGGREEWSATDHLEAALEKAESDNVRYYIRSALQHTALSNGQVDWTGSYGPANGGNQ